MGTFLPLTLGVSAVCGLDFGRTLVFAGACNVATGLMFRTPMCVQPMKAIATLAIAQQLSADQVMTAGLITGIAVFLLALFGVISRLAGAIPEPVVAGIQLGLAAQLVLSVVRMSFLDRGFIGLDGWGAALVALLLLWVLVNNKLVPGALVVFIIGLGMAGAHAFDGAALPTRSSGVAPGSISSFDGAVWRTAATQISLTVTNSVLAVCALSARLFPDRPAPARKVALSVGAMNLAGFVLGGQPMCHGAGGLSGQYGFGARTAGSMVLLGGVKIVCGLLFSSCLFHLLSAFPRSMLGVMLLFSSFELTKSVWRQPAYIDLATCLITAGTMFSFGAGYGLAVGVAAGMLYRQMYLNRRNVNATQPVGAQT
ncbi:MAG: hypothetical protein A2Z18_01420 [Armatimonadetes bacterium RBG_16_58_9]|nr:MAG: hypothetical protein A2Z18_01420 [Armatimonadetes bacterium RBG_16_58_9]